MQYKVTFKWETTETNIGEIIVGADLEEQALKKYKKSMRTEILLSTSTIQRWSGTILVY